MSPPAGTLGFDDLLHEQGAVARGRFIARKLFPTPRFMRTWSRLASRGGVGLALAYLWRPLWVLLQVPRGLFRWVATSRDSETRHRRRTP
jgi:hypothetical protein